MYSSLVNCGKVCLVRGDSTVINGNHGLFSHGGIKGDIVVLNAKGYDPSSLNNTTASPLLTVKVHCQERSKGDMKVTVWANDKQDEARPVRIASFQRTERRSLISKNAEKEIPIHFKNDKSVLATIVPSMTPKTCRIQVDDDNKTVFSSLVPAWQATTQWICFAFLCFVPTFGLAGCFGLYKASNATKITQVSKTTQGSTTKQDLQVVETQDDITTISLEGLSDAKEKLAVILLLCFLEADAMTDTPTNHNASM